MKQDSIQPQHIFSGRRRARSQVLQLLFQAEMQSLDVARLIEQQSFLLDDGPLDPYAQEIAQHIWQDRYNLDEQLDEVALNWQAYRFPLVDKNIMRIALFEIQHDEVPNSVAISEALILAQAYVGEEAGRFVNGILGTLSSQYDHSTQTKPEQTPQHDHEGQ